MKQGAKQNMRRTEKRQNLSTRIRREQIAQAALDVVAEWGVSGLSVARVAQRVGLVPSALYRHFRRLDQVLDAVLELIGQRLMENVEAVCRETTAPMERLRLLLARHVAMIRQNQVIVRIVFSEAIYGEHQAWRNKIRSILHDYLRALSGLISEGQQSGRISRRIDPAVAAVMFLGLIQPAAILWHISNGRFDLDRQTNAAWKVFQRGLVGRKARRHGGT